MDTSFLISAALFLLCLAIRGGYELLKEAGTVNMESKPVFAGVFAAMILLWLSWFTLCPADPFQIDFPPIVRASGLVVFLLGCILAVGALIQLRGVENIDHLVRTGLFKKIRHPMYMGFISWILGWSVYHRAGVSLGIGVLGIASVLWWRHREEARLQAQFGNEYQLYRQTTWF